MKLETGQAVPATEGQADNPDLIVLDITFEKSDDIVKDHIVNGQCIVPGALQIEMLEEAVQHLHLARACTFARIYWFRPLLIADQSLKVKVNVSVKKSPMDCTITVNEKLCTKARIDVLNNDVPSEVMPVLSLEEIRGRMRGQLDKDFIYGGFHERGFDYGPNLRGLKSIWFGADEVLAEIDREYIDENLFSQYVFHPTIVDAAFQSIIGFAQEDEERVLFLPYSIGSINEPWRGNMKEVVAIYTKRITMDVSRGEPQFDLFLVGEDGSVICTINQFCAKLLKNQAKERSNG